MEAGYLGVGAMGQPIAHKLLEARGVEAHVIHSSSVAVSREHRRKPTGSTPSC
jgi:3-hydroxyisobutyrate dehydrogenase-like beta-hydroxyacid dehydrogenase